jgi:hypothetical protein
MAAVARDLGNILIRRLATMVAAVFVIAACRAAAGIVSANSVVSHKLPPYQSQ